MLCHRDCMKKKMKPNGTELESLGIEQNRTEQNMNRREGRKGENKKRSEKAVKGKKGRKNF